MAVKTGKESVALRLYVQNIFSGQL